MTATTTTGQALRMLNSVMIEPTTAEWTHGAFTVGGTAGHHGIEILLPA